MLTGIENYLTAQNMSTNMQQLTFMVSNRSITIPAYEFLQDTTTHLAPSCSLSAQRILAIKYTEPGRIEVTNVYTPELLNEIQEDILDNITLSEGDDNGDEMFVVLIT